MIFALFQEDFLHLKNLKFILNSFEIETSI